MGLQTRLHSGRFRVLIFAVLLAATGCAANELKGTPFFSGQRKQDQKQNRVPAWPLVYYRDPTLSVLWPIFETTDDHFAVRPFYSVYELDKSKHVYNVLWPVAQFDRLQDDNRIFPVFWGEAYHSRYVVVFPVFWNYGNAFSRSGGTNAFFPLWHYNTWGTNAEDYSLFFLWPLGNVRRDDTSSGRRFWPLVGQKSHGSDYTRYELWPLGWQWRHKDESGHCFVPLYYASSDRDGSAFASLLYSRFRSPARGETLEWMVPFYVYANNPKGRTLLSIPWSTGRTNDGRSWRMSFPFFFQKATPASSTFVSLPWSSGRTNDGTSWQFATPVFYQKTTNDSHVLLTPLWMQGSRKDGASTSNWQALIPFYYHEANPDGSRLLATLLGGVQRDDKGRSWLIYPLLSGGKTTESGRNHWILAPLIHAQTKKDSNTSHVLPFYYWNSKGSVFASLVAAQWQNDGYKTTFIPPILSWVNTSADRNDFYLLGGLGRWSWGEKPGSKYLLPLVGWDQEHHVLDSIFYLRTHGQNHGVNETRHIVPPLLSVYSVTQDGDRSTKDLYGLSFLFHHQWGNKQSPSGYFFPLYTFDRDYFYTPLFGWNNKKDFVYPLTPLTGWRHGAKSGPWLFPLFDYSHEKATGTSDLDLFWFLGKYRKDPVDRSTHSYMFPFYWYRHTESKPKADGLPVKNTEKYGTSFISLPAFWYKNQTTPLKGSTRNTLSHGFFPLWNYSSTSRDERYHNHLNILMILYDRKHRAAPEKNADHVRARVLGWLYQYERTNKDVSVDVFPAVTYDNKGDGYRRVSFLWRFFSYENAPDKGKRLDLLFIPIRW